MAGKRVTLPDGQIYYVTPQNSDQVALLDLNQNTAAGRNVDQAATYAAFRQLAGQDAITYTYSGAGAVPNIPQSATDVLNNPIYSVSDTIFKSAPAGVQNIWKGASNFGVATVEGTWDAATGIATSAKSIASGGLHRIASVFDTFTSPAIAETLAIGVVAAAVFGTVWLLRRKVAL